MQLQIQTLRPKWQELGQQNYNERSKKTNDIFLTIKTYHPSEALLTQLRQIQLTSKAHFHYLNNLREKSFKIMSQQDYQFEIEVMQKAFLSFKYLLIQRKQRNNRINFCLSRLKQIQQVKRDKQNIKKLSRLAFQAKLAKNVINQWAFVIKLAKKQQQLSTQIKNWRKSEFVHIFQKRSHQQKYRRIQQQQTNAAVDKMYEGIIQKKYFQHFKIYSKFSKIQKQRKSKHLNLFIRKLIYFKKQTLQKTHKFRSKQELKLKLKILQFFKQNKLQSQCLEWYKYRLQKNYFNKWTQFHELKFNEKQIQQSNQIILQHYLEQKQSIAKIYVQNKYFDIWKSWVIAIKEQKKQTQILKSFSQIRQKQFLSKKYFYLLKLNRNIERATRFHRRQLKIKVVQSLKQNLIRQTEKQANIQKFILNRSLRRYFKKIKLFIKWDQQKVQFFKLKNIWIKFALNLTAQYLQKLQKVKNYHSTLLKFKTMIALKQTLEINRKACYCAFLINIVLPIMRWNKRFKTRKFVQVKQNQTLKRLFFEWKVLTIRKQMTNRKNNYKKTISQLNVFYNNQTFKSQNFSDMIVSKIKKMQQRPVKSEEQIILFKRLNESSSEEDEQRQKKVDALLARIKSHKNQAKNRRKQLQIKQIFTNQKIEPGLITQGIENLRMPTWSTPGNQYHVSVFQDHEY